MQLPARVRLATTILTSFLFGLATSSVRGQTEGPQPGRRTFNGVVAIIGDRVILRTTLDREIEARAQGAELNRERRLELQQQIVMSMARGEIWVQHGKSIGEQAPAAFQQTIDRMVDDTLERRRRESGSFSSLDQEFGLLGTSWEDVRRRQRSDILRQYAYGDVLTKLQQNSGLMVRPCEIRRYYEEHPEQFHREPSADLAWVSFDAGKDPEGALARAKAARAAWAAEPLTGEAIAARFDGNDLGIKTDIRQDESDPRARFLKDFAASAKLGDVSEPIRRGRFFALLRVVTKTEALARPFDDPKVQTSIRTHLAETRSNAWSDQVMLRKQQKIYMWPPSLNLAR